MQALSQLKIKGTPPFNNGINPIRIKFCESFRLTNGAVKRMKQDREFRIERLTRPFESYRHPHRDIL